MILYRDLMQILCDALGSVCILETPTLPDLFHTFLQNRRNLILSLLDVDRNFTHEELKDTISKISSSLFDTLKNVSHLFISEKGPCLFEKFISEVENEGAGSISMLYSENSNFNLLLGYLPDILNHCISGAFDFSIPLVTESIYTNLSTWAESLRQPIYQRLLLILKDVSKAKDLEELAVYALSSLRNLKVDDPICKLVIGYNIVSGFNFSGSKSFLDFFIPFCF
jgi:hypothetical protein